MGVTNSAPIRPCDPVAFHDHMIWSWYEPIVPISEARFKRLCDDVATGAHPMLTVILHNGSKVIIRKNTKRKPQ